MKFLYWMLFGILGFSFTLLFFRGNWTLYTQIYFLMLLCYTWFVFILMAMGERKKEYPSTDYSIAVIVPCYNEHPVLLTRCLESVISAAGDKRIYVIDDGSNNGSGAILDHLAAESHIVLHRFEYNKGKREGLYHAVTQMIQDEEIVVTIDSDTVLDKDALVRIVEPFSDQSVGATSGDVRLLNEKRNFLTRMVASYYWIGLHIYKQAQSSLGIVVCCSGCLSAYRSSLLREVIGGFVTQEFLGERCTHSEDRHLTNLVLKGGWKVLFVPQAVSYTETPDTILGFLKQQQRWKRGYIRESLFTLTYAWRVKPVLFFEILLWELTVPFFSLALMLALVYTIFVSPVFFLTAVLPAWLVFMVIRYVPLFFYAPKKLPGLLIYMCFYDLFLYWQSVYALFTVRNKSWITR